MKLSKVFRFTIGMFFAIPMGLLMGNEILANHLSEKFEYELQNEELLACGGGGGNSPAAKKSKKERKAKVKLSFLKKKLAEAAAAGEPTSDLQDKIDALEASLENN